MNKPVVVSMVALSVIMSGCWTHHEVVTHSDVELKPIVIDMTIRLKEEVDKAVEEESKSDLVKSVYALVDRGVVGLNNKGFFEPRGSISSEETELVVKANSSRKDVFAKIAKEQKSSVEQIVPGFVAQCIKEMPVGAWHQNDKDEWVQKKK